MEKEQQRGDNRETEQQRRDNRETEQQRGDNRETDQQGRLGLPAKLLLVRLIIIVGFTVKITKKCNFVQN